MENLLEDNKKYLDYLKGISRSLTEMKEASEVEFQTYDLNLAPYNKQESEHIYPDELYTYQIVNNLNGKSIKDLNKYEKEQFAQLHSKLLILYIFLLRINTFDHFKVFKKTVCFLIQYLLFQ